MRSRPSCSFRSYDACVIMPLSASVTVGPNFYTAVAVTVLSCGCMKRAKTEGELCQYVLVDDASLAVVIMSA